MGIAGVVVPAVSTGRTFSRRVRVRTAQSTAAPTELNGSSKTSSVAEPATESEVFNWTKVKGLYATRRWCNVVQLSAQPTHDGEQVLLLQ